MDKRTKTYKTISKWKTTVFSKEMLCTLFSKEMLCTLILVFFYCVAFAGLVVKSINDTKKTSPQPVEQKKEASVVKVVEAVETPCTFDPITYVRCSGERLGKSNQDIMTMIRIMKCESGGRPDALNKNTNGTFDVGVLQINDVHSKRISRQDRMDFVKNIDFGWKLHTEQGGFQAWSCYKKVI